MENYNISKRSTLNLGLIDLRKANEYFNSPKIIEGYISKYKLDSNFGTVDREIAVAMFNFFFKVNLLKFALNYAVINKNYNIKNVLIKLINVSNFTYAIDGNTLFLALMETLKVMKDGNFSPSQNLILFSIKASQKKKKYSSKYL